MASDAFVEVQEQGGSAPYTYQLPPGQAFRPTTVSARFNGAAASGRFYPCLAFYTQDGKLLHRSFSQTILQVGDDAEVTFAPFLDRGGDSNAGVVGQDTAYVAAVLADTPWLLWRANETSGLLQDSSGNARHSTGIGGVPQYQVPGAQTGWVAVEVGPSNFIAVLNTGTNAAFTAELWFRPSAAPAAETALWNMGAGGLNGIAFRLQTNLTYRVDAEGVSTLATGSTLTAGAWYHFAVVWNGATWVYYLNGSVDVANAGTQVPAIPSGTWRLGPTASEVARLSHWTHYTSALSAGDIAAHYAAAFR